jgi:hypothetical protein
MSRRRSLRLLLLAAAVLAPAPARAYCVDAFERDGVVYFDAPSEIRRFDLATGVFAAPVPIADPPGAYRLAADGGVVWIQRFASIDGLDLGGNVVAQIPVSFEVVDLEAADGHVFVLGTTELHSYDAATGALEDTIPLPPIQYGGIVAVPGSRVVLHAQLWLQTVAYAADGELGAIVPVYELGTFAMQRLERSAGGRLVAEGAFFDATTLRFVEGYGGELAVAVGAELVTLDETLIDPFPPFFNYTTIRRYDAERKLVGMEVLSTAIGPPYHSFFSDGSALWALDCNSGGDFSGRFDRIELDDIAPPVLPAPIPQAGFDDGVQFGAETGDDGVLYFLALNGERQVRRWLPEEDTFLASLPVAEPPLGLSRATGGGVFVHYAYGRITRLAPDGTESAVPRLPGGSSGASPILEAPPWWILNGAGVHVFDADGSWRGVYEDFLGTDYAVWDAPRSRIVRISGSTDVAGTLDVAPDGSITTGPDGPVDLSYPLIASGGDRILARDRIVDAETLAVVAVLPRVVTGADEALWHGPERLVTITYGNFEVTVYAEYTADGEASGPAVLLPGLPEAILPLGERALLVRRIAGEFVFTVVTPGGDLDSDGTANGADAFPIDPAEHSDRDGDGVGDNADPFPDDPNESSDQDGDGLGDGTDYLPDVAAARVAAVSGDDWLGIVGIGRSGHPVAGQVHLLADGGFAFCIGPHNCLDGTWREAVAGRKIDAVLAPEPLVAFGEAIRLDLEGTFERLVAFRFLTERARAKLLTDRDGTVRLTVRVPHRTRIYRIGRFTGAYRIRATGTWLELTPAAP